MNPLRRLFSRPTPHTPHPDEALGNLDRWDGVVPAVEPDPVEAELAVILATTPRGKRAAEWTERSRRIDVNAAILVDLGIMAPPRGAHKAVES